MVIRAKPADDTLAARGEHTYPTVALMLQGGGALGSCQGGAVEVLAESGIQP